MTESYVHTQLVDGYNGRMSRPEEIVAAPPETPSWTSFEPHRTLEPNDLSYEQERAQAILEARRAVQQAFELRG